MGSPLHEPTQWPTHGSSPRMTLRDIGELAGKIGRRYFASTVAKTRAKMGALGGRVFAGAARWGRKRDSSAARRERNREGGISTKDIGDASLRMTASGGGARDFARRAGGGRRETHDEANDFGASDGERRSARGSGGAGIGRHVPDACGSGARPSRAAAATAQAAASGRPAGKTARRRLRGRSR